MKREIKFRAWDKKQNKFAQGVSIEIDGRIGKPLGRYELQQYTGLKDKNGKEIYEGDILKTEYEEIEIGEIEFMPFGCVDCGFHIRKKGIARLLQLDDEDIYEVIGNIFENPELLK